MNLKEFFYFNSFKEEEFHNCPEVEFKCINPNCNEIINTFDHVQDYMVGRGKQKEITNKVKFDCPECGEEYTVNVKYKVGDMISLESAKGTKKFW